MKINYNIYLLFTLANNQQILHFCSKLSLFNWNTNVKSNLHNSFLVVFLPQLLTAFGYWKPINWHKNFFTRKTNDFSSLSVVFIFLKSDSTKNCSRFLIFTPSKDELFRIIQFWTNRCLFLSIILILFVRFSPSIWLLSFETILIQFSHQTPSNIQSIFRASWKKVNENEK